jgi:hypothetical protein
MDEEVFSIQIHGTRNAAHIYTDNMCMHDGTKRQAIYVLQLYEEHVTAWKYRYFQISSSFYTTIDRKKENYNRLMNSSGTSIYNIVHTGIHLLQWSMTNQILLSSIILNFFVICHFRLSHS